MAVSLPYLYGLTTMAFITTNLVVAAVRWFHMCRPYDRRPEYYYPGRPYLTAIFLSSAALLPYALQPESLDAWFLARAYFLPVILFHFSILLLAYFGSVMHWRKWRWPMFWTGCLVGALLIAAFVLAVWPGEQLGGVIPLSTAHWVLYGVGLLLTAACATAITLVVRWARRFDEDDFSNPADFPVAQARRWMGMILTNIPMCWTAALSGSRAVMAVIHLMTAVAIVAFILTALHPHRTQPVEEPEAPDSPAAEQKQMYQRAMPAKKRQEILAAVKTAVEDGKAFLDPHLTLQDISDRSGYSRTYVSGLLKTEHGGFFNYINRLRLEHVDVWLRAHPGATIREAAEESGFVSRQAYYKVRARMPKEG